eukprot:8436852-Karenia_brevis.AAC.1
MATEKTAAMPLQGDAPVASGGTAYVNAVAESQASFFKKLDSFDLQAEAAYSTSTVNVSTPEKKGTSIPFAKVHSILSSFSSRRPSHTLVLEAAMHLIEQ